MPRARKGQKKFPILKKMTGLCHSRRIYKEEENAKVLASVWGDNIYSIPCRASYFAPGRFEE